MPNSKKYFTGNKSADSEIAYLQKTFPNNAAAKRQIKYLVNKFGAQTLSGKAERSRTSTRSKKLGK
jgi:cytolysin (calcineurin-like family phosphatase)